MAKRKYLTGLIVLVFLLFSTAFSFPSTRLQNKSAKVSSINLFDVNMQWENPKPKWKKVIEEAFASLGETSRIEWNQTDDFYYSASVRGYLLDGYSLTMSISTRSIFELVYCETCSGSVYDTDIKEINFHSQKAQLITVSREIYGTESHDIEWEMNGLYYYVTYTAIGYEGAPEQLYPAADALYYAAGGTGGASAPAPQPEPDNQPSDVCSGVSCKNNYCSIIDGVSKYLYNCVCDPNDGGCHCNSDTCEMGCDEVLGGCVYGGGEDLCMGLDCGPDRCSDDGSAFLYDCQCDPRDGECYCRQDTCTAGCDIEQGGCIGAADGMCNDVVCETEYCEEDGKTRNYDCKCDPADGGCYCYSEVCETGCNMATGKCEMSMVINDPDSGNDNDNVYYDNSPDAGDILGIVGGVAVGGGTLIGGGYLAFKGIQGFLARQALKKAGGAAAKAAAQASEPSLSELLARAEESADRALNRVDMAQRALKPSELHYRNILERNVKYDAQWAKTMSDRAALIEKAEMGVKIVKKGADVAAEIVGSVPGGGNVFKYGYNLSTTAAESIASGDSIGTVALKTTSKGVETFAGNRLFGNVTVLDNMAKNTIKGTVKQAIKKTGAENIVLEAVKNEGTNNFMNLIKGTKNHSRFGKIEKKIEAVAKKVDRKAVGRMLKRVLYH